MSDSHRDGEGIISKSDNAVSLAGAVINDIR